jgi:hypothetical protein
LNYFCPQCSGPVHPFATACGGCKARFGGRSGWSPVSEEALAQSKRGSVGGILLVTGINLVVLFSTSLLAAGGDGSDDGVTTVRIGGSIFIAFFSLVGVLRWLRGRPGTPVAALALPVGFLASAIFAVIARALGYQVG